MPRVPALSLALALPFYVAFVWAPTWPLALVFLTGAMFLNYFYLSSSVALVQEEVRPDQRVMSGALLLLVMNFIGLGLGPTCVGAASDWFAAHRRAALAAGRALHAHALLSGRDPALPLAGADPSPRRSGRMIDIRHSTAIRHRLLRPHCRPCNATPTPAMSNAARRHRSGGRRARRRRARHGRRRSARVQGHPLRAAAGRPAALAAAASAPALEGRARRHRVRPGLPSTRAQAVQHLRRQADADERGLPDAQHLDARQREERAGVLLDLRRRAADGREPRADVRRQAPRRARRRRRLDQLSTRRARLARASRAERGVAERASPAITACSTRSAR